MNTHEVNWRIPRKKILSRGDVGKILQAAKKADLRDYTFLVIGANVGLRLCEIVHLKVEDFDRDQLTVVRRKKHRLDREPVDLGDPVSRAIRSWVSGLPKGAVWMFPGDSGPCQRGKNEKLCSGGHVSRREIQRRWTSYLKATGLLVKGRGIHALRHYAVTEFYSTHKDLRAAQMFAGHTSPLITQVYAHVVDMREKVQKVKVTL